MPRMPQSPPEGPMPPAPPPPPPPRSEPSSIPKVGADYRMRLECGEDGVMASNMVVTGIEFTGPSMDRVEATSMLGAGGYAPAGLIDPGEITIHGRLMGEITVQSGADSIASDPTSVVVEEGRIRAPETPLPCPKCGAQPPVLREHKKHGQAYVACGCERSKFGPKCDGEAIAIAAWNRQCREKDDANTGTAKTITNPQIEGGTLDLRGCEEAWRKSYPIRKAFLAGKITADEANRLDEGLPPIEPKPTTICPICKMRFTAVIHGVQILCSVACAREYYYGEGLPTSPQSPRKKPWLRRWWERRRERRKENRALRVAWRETRRRDNEAAAMKRNPFWKGGKVSE